MSAVAVVGSLTSINNSRNTNTNNRKNPVSFSSPSSPSSVFTLLAIVLCTTLLQTVSGHNYDKIYLDLDGSHYCFRRLNQTHQIGCSSAIGGSTGIAKRISEDQHQEADLEFLRSGGSSPPYVAIISVGQLANMTLIQQLKSLGGSSSGRLNGILVLDTDKKPDALSADRSCPNEFRSLYAADPQYGHCRLFGWNTPTADHHQGLLFQDLPFPLFVLRNRSQIELVGKKLEEHAGGEWPRLAVQLSSPMHAAKDSVTCLRRSRMNARFNMYDDVLCDAIGGNNIFHHSFNLSATRRIERNSVVVLAARQDSFSLLDGLAPGADSAISSTVVLMAVAEMLHQDPAIRAAISASHRKLLFALFDGEAFDYIGSSDTVHQMVANELPLADPYRISAEKLHSLYPSLNLTHLSHLIELSQLGQYRSRLRRNGSTRLNQRGSFFEEEEEEEEEVHQIFLHKDPKSAGVPTLVDLVNSIKTNAVGLNKIKVTEVEGSSSPLPPSSAQSFLKKRPATVEDGHFAVLVAANHRQGYLNRHYNSFLEDGQDFVPAKVLARRLTDLATLFGRVLYQLVTGRALTPGVRASDRTVGDLLTCYLNNSNCRLFQEVAGAEETKLINGTQPPYSTYVSVFQTRNELRLVNRALLFRFTGQVMSGITNATECDRLGDAVEDKQFRYWWLYGSSLAGECVRSSAYMVPTTSPAIDPASLTVRTDLLSEYSLWTESKWQSSSVRLFVVPSPLQRALVVVLGLLVAAASLAVVWWVSRYGNGEGRLFFISGGSNSTGNNSSVCESISNINIGGSGGGGGGSRNMSSSSNSSVGGGGGGGNEAENRGNHHPHHQQQQQQWRGSGGGGIGSNGRLNQGGAGGGDGSSSPAQESTTSTSNTRTTVAALNGGPAVGNLLDS
ncbi:hypothetical protein TYRP_016270 [Tyrophagus putrescentiae]|nr:hypothetical protein TYRP_016270 [Tyrophagus putrescentiae]